MESKPTKPNRFEPPKADIGQPSDLWSHVKRGVVLTGLLVLILLFNAFTAVTLAYYALDPGFLPHVPRTLTPVSSFVFAFGAFLNVVFALMIWFWKKAGVYGFVVVALFLVAADVFHGHSMLSATRGLVVPLFLVILVRNKWERFV